MKVLKKLNNSEWYSDHTYKETDFHCFTVKGSGGKYIINLQCQRKKMISWEGHEGIIQKLLSKDEQQKTMDCDSTD